MFEQEQTSQNKPQRDEKGRLLPGNTANLNGRPRGSISITERIKQKLLEVPEGQKKSYLEILVTKILKKAISEEDFQTMKQIWAYVDGMPKLGIDYLSKSEITVNQNVNLLERLFLNLDYATREKINARLLAIADEQGGDSESGLQERFMLVDRTGDIQAEGDNKELEVREIASGVEQNA